MGAVPGAAIRSAKTVQVYLESVRQLERFLEASSLPTAPAALRREHIEAWIEDLLGQCKPVTASVRFRSVQQFFKFLAERVRSTPRRCERCGRRSSRSSPWRSYRPRKLEQLIRSIADAYVTLCVHAGIAAADAICCARLGEHAHGDDHQEAVALLSKADRPSAKYLKVLLDLKTRSGYSTIPTSKTDQKRAGRAAAALVSAARAIG